MIPRVSSPIIARAWAAIGEINYRTGRWAQAARAYDKAIMHDCRKRGWYVSRARAYEHANNPEAAAKAYVVALAETDNFPTSKNLIRIVSLINRLIEAGRAEVATSLRDALRRNLGLDEIEALKGNGVKIAYISNSPMPDLNASCVHAMKLCDALSRSGKDLILVSSQPEMPHWESTNDALEFFGVPNLKLVLFESTGNDKADDINKIAIALKNRATHCLSRSPVAAYCAALTGMPIIFERHSPFNADAATLSRDMFRQPFFRGLVVTTNALKHIIEQELSDSNVPIYPVPNAADPPQPGETDFELTNLEGTAFQVGYSGHLYPGKGLEIILELAQRLPDVGFHILGGYERDVDFWRVKITELENIHFYGFRPLSEVSSFLRKIDAALAPYLKVVGIFGGTEQDQSSASSLKLFEYMAHGLPIVASDLPAVREVLRHGENALLCDPDNLESWIAAIVQIKGDRELRASLAHEAQADFRANYTWDIRASRLISILKA